MYVLKALEVVNAAVFLYIAISTAGNIEEYYSINERVEEYCNINERVTGLVIKVNKRYRLKAVQDYASTSGHDDHLVGHFCEDVENRLWLK